MENFTVKKGDAGERLDKYLVKKLRDVSRQSVKQLIDAGCVKVNSRRVIIAKWKMLEGDEIFVRMDGRGPSEGSGGEAKGAREERRERFIKVIYEDRDIIVVDKPSGVVVQSGARTSSGTYVDSIREYLKRKYGGKGSHVVPVHRLDRETSGLMVFAKSREGERLIEQFKKHAVKRSYLAVVEGALTNESGRIDYPIKKGDFGHSRKAGIGRKGEGAEACTDYRVKERYGSATLVKLDLRTGRTHQARVHMAAIRHPIAGDRVYGASGSVRFKRQALHSHILSFRHPASGRQMTFTSDLPADMEELVERLRRG